MPVRSPIFEALAAIYEESQAGRTGRGQLDIQPTWLDLEKRFQLLSGHRLEGEYYDLALHELRGQDGKILKLQWAHPRAKTSIFKVRLSPANEAAFYAALGRESPTRIRVRWRDLFLQARSLAAKEPFADAWQSFCTCRAAQAEHWEMMEPFRLRKHREGEFLLDTTRRLLAWKGNNLIRWVSSHLCADSKRLERRQKALEPLLHEASGGLIANFESHGILPMPRDTRLSGPLLLRTSTGMVDCGAQEVSTLSLADLEHADFVSCTAKRCLTVENKTVFLDLAGKRSGELIIWTSFPTAATIALLGLLPSNLEFWHYGDTDPSGFHILEDLCCRSKLPFRPFRMQIRSGILGRPLTASEGELLARLVQSSHLKESRNEIAAMSDRGTVGAYEQEDHQPAPLNRWPYY